MTSSKTISKALRNRRIGKILLVIAAAISVAIFLWKLFSIFLLSLTGFAIVVLYFISYKKPAEEEREALIDEWNRGNESYEYSSRLFEKTNLSDVERIQLGRVEKAIANNSQAESAKKFQWSLNGYHLLLLLAFMAPFLPSSAHLATETNSGFVDENLSEFKTEVSTTQKAAALQVHLNDIRIVPPTYTNLPSTTVRKQSELLEVPENSNLVFTVESSRPISDFYLQDMETMLPFRTGKGNRLIRKLNVSEDKLIQFIPGNSKPENSISAIKLIAKKDLPPILRSQNMKAFQELKEVKGQSLKIDLELEDDYGLVHCKMISTLSKGKGESVKFTERTDAIPLSSNKKQNIIRSFELSEWDFEPGDQLYYHFELSDNREPIAGKSRSSTFMIEYIDSTKVATFVSGGLGVDIMPEYFRSQRQLIIDTEALLTQKSELSNSNFMDESNRIAKDQKILRLRYGKFLGEESESSAGGHHAEEGIDQSAKIVEKRHVLSPAVGVETDQSEEVNHQDHSGHDHSKHDHEDHSGHDHTGHDHEDEDHDHEDQTSKNVDGHNHGEHVHGADCTHEIDSNAIDHQSHDHDDAHEGHDHGPEKPKNGDKRQTAEEMLMGYAHFHDNMEEATYFNEGIKGKLRAALNFMWKSELELRLGEPNKSLSHQKEALRLIKWIQQESRIYVERIGLEIPQINELKKRGTGDLKGSLSSALERDRQQQLWRESEKLVQMLLTSDFQNKQSFNKQWNLSFSELQGNALKSAPFDLELLALMNEGPEDILEPVGQLRAEMILQKFLQMLPDSQLKNQGNAKTQGLRELQKIYRKKRALKRTENKRSQQ